MLAQEFDRRRLGLAQGVIRARQQYRNDARARHRHDAGFVEIFEMVGGQRRVFGGERGAALVGQLLGVQLDWQARPPRGLEHAADLFARERDALAKAVDGVDQSFACERRQHFVGDGGDVAGAVFGEFRRQGVSAQESRRDFDFARFGKAARDAQRFAFGREIETIARLDLDRPDALGDQRIEPRQVWRKSSSSLAARVAFSVERIPPPARAMSA